MGTNLLFLEPGIGCQHFRGKIFESFPLFIRRVDISTPSSSGKSPENFPSGNI